MKKKALYIPYYGMLKYTKWLIEQRDITPQNEQIHSASANTAIIINCCIVLEGFLYTLIKDYLFIVGHRIADNSQTEKRQHHHLLFERILNEYSLRLNNDSWNGYLRLFELFTGIDIPKDTQLWKSVKCLFQFRNLLVHGNEMEFLFNDIRNSKPYSTNRKFNTVLSYCEEFNLPSINFENQSVNLLSNTIADHFFSVMKKFAIEVFELIPEDERAKTMIEMFEFYE